VQRADIHSKLDVIRNYFHNNNYKVEITEPTMSQMLEQIENERKMKDKQNLIDKYTQAKFKLIMAEREDNEYDPIQTHLDPNLTYEEKQKKKIKKILYNIKAFYMYKKGGSLLRDKDYLNISQRIRNKLLIDSMRQNIHKRRKTIDHQKLDSPVVNSRHPKSISFHRDVGSSINVDTRQDRNNNSINRKSQSKLPV